MVGVTVMVWCWGAGRRGRLFLCVSVFGCFEIWTPERRTCGEGLWAGHPQKNSPGPLSSKSIASVQVTGRCVAINSKQNISLISHEHHNTCSGGSPLSPMTPSHSHSQGYKYKGQGVRAEGGGRETYLEVQKTKASYKIEDCAFFVFSDF